MARVLILFAHPAFEKSKVHTRLLKRIRNLSGITFHDLYQLYPDFDIDVKKEQALLLSHDIIIWQHPFYWYSCPPLLKQWEDLVLEHGWAYGTGGDKLTDKWIFNAITSGGSKQMYSSMGRNRFPIRTFLAPFDQTANLCHMKYLPPFVVDGTLKLSNEIIEQSALQYERLLIALQKDQISIEEWSAVEYLNDLNIVSQLIQS